MATASDSFTDTTGTALEDHTGESASWTRIDGIAGAVDIIGNELDVISNTDTSWKVSPAPGDADHQVAVTASSGLNSFGYACARIVDHNDWGGGIQFKSSSSVAIDKNVAGTVTELGSVGSLSPSGKTYRVRVSGNDYYLDEDGTEIGGPYTSSDHNTVTDAGLQSYHSTGGTWITDWESSELGGGGAANVNERGGIARGVARGILRGCWRLATGWRWPALARRCDMRRQAA